MPWCSIPQGAGRPGETGDKSVSQGRGEVLGQTRRSRGEVLGQTRHSRGLERPIWGENLGEPPGREPGEAISREKSRAKPPKTPGETRGQVRCPRLSPEIARDRGSNLARERAGRNSFSRAPSRVFPCSDVMDRGSVTKPPLPVQTMVLQIAHVTRTLAPHLLVLISL